MEFLHANLLWGLSALVIPIAIHFWYQKKGKVITWAATQWLTDKTSLQHRGLRLDELPLLLLRCLLLILLVMILSQPVLDWWKTKNGTSKIHLVEPSKNVANNFRFELENAKKNGEKVFWISPEKTAFENITSFPKRSDSELFIQQNISELDKPGDELHLYLNNRQSLADLPRIYIPGPFRIHSVVDSVGKERGYLELEGGKKLLVDNKTGQLKLADQSESRLAASPVHKGKVEVLLDYANAEEQETVRAALAALTDIYAIPFAIDVKLNPEKKYDWILTNKEIHSPDPQTLYLTSNESSLPAENVVLLPDSLTLSSSSLVQNGQLPEKLGEILIGHLGLDAAKTHLSQQQLGALFATTKPVLQQNADRLRPWLLLLFVLTLLLERWISLRKTANPAYA